MTTSFCNGTVYFYSIENKKIVKSPKKKQIVLHGDNISKHKKNLWDIHFSTIMEIVNSFEPLGLLVSPNDLNGCQCETK